MSPSPSVLSSNPTPNPAASPTANPAPNPTAASSALSRRGFLAASGAGLAGAATLAVTGLGTRVALAAPGAPLATSGDVLVAVFLRGGCDGLSLAPPYGYPSYRRLRPTIAVDPPGGADGALPLTSDTPGVVFPTGLDGVVGLHPAMRPLYDALWSRGRLAVMPATGIPNSESATRSHFSATRHLERGSASPTVGGGWLGRMVNVGGPATGVPAVRTSTRSNLLQGANGAASVTRLDSFGINGFRNTTGVHQALGVLHGGGDGVSTTGRSVLDLIDHVSAVERPSGAGYPDTRLGRTMSELSAIIRAGIGVRAAAVDYGGWDHHRNHGTVGNGRFHDNAADLAASLAGFAADTDGLEGVCVVVTTEFGRTINENGNRGTDHGRAATHLAMGAGIQGGVFGDDYPDEIRDDPATGDLTVHTDFRKPLTEIISRRTDVTDLGTVFPAYSPGGQLGVARTRA